MRFFSTILICLFCFTGCDNERAELILAFDALNESTTVSAYKGQLDQRSLDYYNQITNTDNLTIDKVVEIGKAFHLPYFSVMMLASCGDFMKRENNPDHLFHYIMSKSISFFDRIETFKADEKKSRIGKDNFVSIYREGSGARWVSWARFSKEGEQFKYDLLFTLQQEEKQLKKIYSDQRAKHPKLTTPEFLKLIFPSYNNQACDIDKIINKLNKENK